METQAKKAELFRSMHSGPQVLVLPNAWDVPSARVFEDSGFRAVATSSAGVMVSLGYQDGEEIPLEEYLAVIRRISDVLSVPLSVDLVGGFGETPASTVKNVRRAVAAGAVGINIEDFKHSAKKMLPLSRQLDKVKALVRLRERMEVEFVINARTDALRYGPGDEEAKMKEAITRAAAYRDAGADCVYPMGLVAAEGIAAFVEALDHPVNVMVRKGLPSLSELKRLGVARVSFGPSASYATMGLLRRASEEVLRNGTYGALLEGAITFDELNALAVPKKAIV